MKDGRSPVTPDVAAELREMLGGEWFAALFAVVPGSRQEQA